MRTFLATLLTSLLVIAPGALSQFDYCGDFDNNGMTTVADIVAAMKYLYEGDVPPVNFDQADFDLHQKLTFRDVAHIWQCAFICDFWNVQCPPTEPPFVAPVDSTLKIIHPDAVPANNTKFGIDLRISGPVAIGFSYPLQLRIDGAVPTIDSVVFPVGAASPPYAVAVDFVDPANGIITLVGLRNTAGFSYEHFARIFVTIPSLPTERPMTIEWVKLTPAQSPVGQEEAVFALASKPSFAGEVEPVFDPTCCNVPGDYNGDGHVNISDIVAMVTYIFGGIFPPDCLAEIDANGSGNLNIADAVYLVNFIFAGGTAPVCYP